MSSPSRKVLVICREAQLPFYRALLDQRDWEVDYVSSEQAVVELFRSGTFRLVEFVFIQIRLKWAKDAAYGLRIATRLRVVGLRCPIHLHSYLPRAYFDLRLPELAFLRAEHYHRLVTLPLPADYWDRLDFQAMLEYKRLDIVRNLLDPRSLVSEVTHELKNKVLLATDAQDWGRINSLIHQKFAELRLMFPDYGEGISATEQQLVQRVTPCLNPEHGGQISGFIDGASPRLQGLFPQPLSESEQLSSTPTKKPWKVLFFDDELGMHHIFRALFTPQGIDCITVGSGEAALEELERDKNDNRISVVICDIRILREDSAAWKKYQGYDLMWTIRQSLSNMVELVALTSGKSHLLQLLQDDQIKFHRALKQDVLSSEGAKRMFANRIRDLGDHMFFKSRSRPRHASWIKNGKRFARPLSHYYREHLLAFDYESAEETINERAMDYYDNWQRGIANPAVKFMGTMNRDLPHSPEGLQKFRERTLLGRRVALALHLDGGQSEKDIFRILMQKNGDEIPQDSINLLLNTSFSLSLKKDLPSPKHIAKKQYLGSGLLEEEILWLVQNFEVDFELRGLRSSEQDKATISYLLDDFRYELRQQLPSPIDPTDKKLQQFLKAKFDNIRDLTAAQRWLREANRLAGAHGLRARLHREFREELEAQTLQNTELRQFLESQIKG
ncbi:MAG: response regulator [Bacteroidota bacterium]